MTDVRAEVVVEDKIERLLERIADALEAIAQNIEHVETAVDDLVVPPANITVPIHVPANEIPQVNPPLPNPRR